MSKDETGIWYFSRFIIPKLREIVLQILSIWGFQESFLSTIIPRNLMSETFSKGVSSRITSIGIKSFYGFTEKHVYCLLEIKWQFIGSYPLGNFF